MRRYGISMLIIGLAMLSVTPVLAQGKVHALLIGDTNDAGIGSGAQANVTAFAKFVQAIGVAINNQVITKQIVGADFNCANIAAAVKAISTTNDDLVVFYYAGHGFREDGQRSRFPRLWCRSAPSETPLLEDIALGFRSRDTFPRMVWTVADACNTTSQDAEALTAAAGAVEQQGLLKLFGRPRGTMLMSGADMHQFSWYFPDGGQFSKNLLDVLTREVRRGTSASWASLLPGAMRAFETRYNNRTFIQQPIYTSTLVEPQ
jgi:hypothetical protein